VAQAADWRAARAARAASSAGLVNRRPAASIAATEHPGRAAEPKAWPSHAPGTHRLEPALADAHPDVREVLGACAVLRAEIGGAFDAWRGGRLDPSGYVKGWAAERAADVRRAAGARRFALNVGGDIVCAGEPVPGGGWRVGVRHPDDPASLVLVLAVRDGAVATSAMTRSANRGCHGGPRKAREGPAPRPQVNLGEGLLGRGDQPRRGVGLGQERGFAHVHPAPDHVVLGVAGRDQHADARPRRAQ